LDFPVKDGLVKLDCALQVAGPNLDLEDTAGFGWLHDTPRKALPDC
jgi:hypothetical protein